MSQLTPRIQQLLENNKVFATTWPNPPTMTQMRQSGRAAGGGLLILTCLDPRIVPEQFFGPGLGAGVIRNAGGRFSKDVVTTILSIRTLVDVRSVMVIHHTDCGMSHLTDAEILDDARARTPDANLSGVEPGCFTDAEYIDAIKQDVLAMRAEKALAGMKIWGFEMDTVSGLVRPVDV